MSEFYNPLEDGDFDFDSELAYFKRMQALVNNGSSAWCLEGSVGRGMMDAIQGGFILLGREPAKDYWGNRIPSRDEVKPGTPGSREFVVEKSGECWAYEMEGLE